MGENGPTRDAGPREASNAAPYVARAGERAQSALAAARAGQSPSEIARSLGVALRTVQGYLARAGEAVRSIAQSAYATSGDIKPPEAVVSKKGPLAARKAPRETRFAGSDEPLDLLSYARWRIGRTATPAAVRFAPTAALLFGLGGASPPSWSSPCDRAHRTPRRAHETESPVPKRADLGLDRARFASIGEAETPVCGAASSTTKRIIPTRDETRAEYSC